MDFIDTVMPGSRVSAWDCGKKGWAKATVVKRYGQLQKVYDEDLILGPYPDLVDLVFDHRPDKVSHGHFTDGLKEIHMKIVAVEFSFGTCVLCSWPLSVKYITDEGECICFECVKKLEDKKEDNNE